MTTVPYGSWPSPVTAAGLASSGHAVDRGVFVGGQVWWSEVRPDQGGRTAVRRPGDDGSPVDVLPAPWNARSRVHEYGGGAWTVTGDGAVVFAEFSDQRLYRFDAATDPVLSARPDRREPRPLTPTPTRPGGWRYADLTLAPGGREIWCVRETHGAGQGGGRRAGRVARDLAAVPLDGSAADDPGAIRSLTAGSDFLAYPRPSPDGRSLAWIAWDHPQMPWDGTELRVADFGPDGVCGPARTLLGSPTESVLQPEWADDDHLYVISDRSGWWNLYRIARSGGEPEALAPAEADFGGPLWNLGVRWYAPLADGGILTVRTHGTDRVGRLDPATAVVTDIDLGDLTSARITDTSGGRVVVRGAGARTASGLRVLDLGSGALEVVRLSVDELPDPAYLPEARAMTFGRAREVHAVVYPPRNPDCVAPAGELAPFVAFVHGGPTTHVAPALNPVFAYFTSRGIGVVDVNYGGSTGYGREYRDRLRGQWGVVDVEDTVAVMGGLVEAGLADPARLAIEGGSAGGWTVLSALTATDVFACGASYYGVAELVDFAADTHDFESRYLDGLIGPWPEARALYDLRAPVNHVDQLSCPVLLLQGLDDPIVPPSQSQRFRDAMVAKAIPHAYLAYAGESHGFRAAATIVSAREAELSFYGQIMGFATPGVPELELWRP